MRYHILQLQRAMGITASSEKRKNSGDSIGPSSNRGDAKPKAPEKRAGPSKQRIIELEAKHRRLAKKYRRHLKELDRKQRKADDLASEKLADSISEDSEFNGRLTVGGPSDQSFETPDQALMQSEDTLLVEEAVAANVDTEVLVGQIVMSSLKENRTRYGFNFVVSKLTVEVEKVVLKDEDSTTKIVSRNTKDLGPPGMAVIWELLANMAIGNLLSICGKRSNAAMLSRLFCYSAGRFVPIYLHLFQSLRNSVVLSGDDTQTRVLEFAAYQKNLKDSPETDSPWATYATAEKAKQTLAKKLSPSLGEQTAAELGFEWDRKNGCGQKKSLQTTVLSGRSEPKDPRSTIVFYRSHVGSFGNLLTLSLASRSPEFKKIIVQSDLATINLVTDAEVEARFDIEMAGCASHARRPFVIYQAEDTELCKYMLHFFKGLYIYEKCLDLQGRNEANVRTVRNVDSRKAWNDIRNVATIMEKKWSKQTKLGEAARYILKHFKKLTAYLDNPMISISNDFSERMLGMEKLIQANALFRKSLEGRFSLDIMRTIFQTAAAAKAPLAEYLFFVLRSDQAKIRANPENYTPLAYAKSKITNQVKTIPALS